MTKPKLTYFDAAVSRGEECRLALHVAGIAFDDNRISREAWAALKPTSPFGGLPFLELPGKPALGQCNAILGFIGRSHGMHPQDPFEAAVHEALMVHVEDLRALVSPTVRISDATEKQKAREALVAGPLPAWGERAEKHIGAGPFLAGAKLSVADIKLYMAVRWFATGGVDHIPATIFASFPKLTRLYESVRDDARIKSWYAKS